MGGREREIEREEGRERQSDTERQGARERLRGREKVAVGVKDKSEERASGRAERDLPDPWNHVSDPRSLLKEVSGGRNNATKAARNFARNKKLKLLSLNDFVLQLP